MAGSGGVIVLDDSRDMVWALNNINEFYAHESCGQCTPCREGSLWMKKITDRMLLGGGVTQDPATLEERRRQHRRPNHLRFRRSLRLADPKFSWKSSRTNSPQRAQKPVPPPMPPEYTAGGIDRRRGNPHRVARPRSRLGKSRRARNDLNLETRKPEKESGIVNCSSSESSEPRFVFITELGPGFLESLYEEALAIELRTLGIQFERQKPVPIFYRAQPIGQNIGSILLVERSALSSS